LARVLEVDEKLYPFLEMRFTTNQEVSDLFYHIDAVGKVGDYEVGVRVEKPTSDRTLFGSFTIVF
jgi:hypothetical protein